MDGPEEIWNRPSPEEAEPPLGLLRQLAVITHEATMEALEAHLRLYHASGPDAAVVEGFLPVAQRAAQRVIDAHVARAHSATPPSKPRLRRIK